MPLKGRLTTNHFSAFHEPELLLCPIIKCYTDNKRYRVGYLERALTKGHLYICNFRCPSHDGGPYSCDPDFLRFYFVSIESNARHCRVCTSIHAFKSTSDDLSAEHR